MRQVEATPTDEAARRRTLRVSVVTYAAVVMAIAVFLPVVARREGSLAATIPFAVLPVLVLIDLIVASWWLATRNHVGPSADMMRRLRRTSVWYPVVVAAAMGFILWNPASILRSRHVASFSRGDYDRAMGELNAAQGEASRLYALARAAKTSVFFGSLADARRYATELVVGARRRPGHLLDGNAIHDGHEVLGLVALREGRVEDAKAELLLAGGTPGAPNLGSFGPNMMLAKELLERREDATVLAYFTLCGRFWEHAGRLEKWSSDVRAGRTPDFGANLIY